MARKMVRPKIEITRNYGTENSMELFIKLAAENFKNSADTFEYVNNTEYNAGEMRKEAC